MRLLEADVEQWIEERLLNDPEWSHLHIELSKTSVPVSPLRMSEPCTEAYLTCNQQNNMLVHDALDTIAGLLQWPLHTVAWEPVLFRIVLVKT